MDSSRVNIGAIKSHRLMKEHVGGYENMTASVTDFKNFQRDITKHIKGKDVHMLIENFKRKQQMCSSFFFKYEVDDKQHLIRVFWADAIGRKTALLYREDIKSFKWLFEAFRNAMSDCDPTCLITDQDPAMKITIERVFDSSRTRHRLCMWYIMNKVPEKVCLIVSQNEDFMSEFCNCVWSKHTKPGEFNEL
ncbi:Protein FAR1-RELATED SEQUENCE 3 [Bienertia sinuspersici]